MTWLQRSIVAVILLLPVGALSLPGAGVAVILAAMAVPAALVLLLLLRADTSVRPSWLLAALALNTVSGLVSAFVAVDPVATLTLLAVSLLTLGYATALTVVGQRSDSLRTILTVTLIVGGGIAGWALTQAGSLAVAAGGGVIDGRLQGPFAQPNELGAFCAALLPIGVIAIATAPSPRFRMLYVSATALLTIAWVLSMSRGSWMGGFAALTLLAVCHPSSRRRLAITGVLGAGFVVTSLLVPSSAGVLAVVGARLRTLQSGGSNPYDDRPLIWQEAWHQSTERPWLGSAAGGYRGWVTDGAGPVSQQPPDHAHNMLLTILAERGAIGLACASAVIVAGLLVLVRGWKIIHASPPPLRSVRRDAAWSVAAMTGLASLAVQGVIDMPLRNPIVTALTWTLLGCAAATETITRTWLTTPQASTQRQGVATHAG
jgi:putative inorganic carbon (hco3(-)) transporter